MAPESPWWLVRKGKVQEAEKVIKRLADKDVGDEELHRSVMLMVETNRMEKSMHEGVGYADCLNGSNLWRTEIACAGCLLCGVASSSRPLQHTFF
ncbi:hypothetical protein BJX68DRAFT_231651 [Aspergillus pseudodeflectus]|uniref:Major facilitator superfamily (MFS) profile domain-containing protein n=1 Tax=Aspergillus pseudodeflectus TaxID=176178 RepID=A0ABR4KS88_9EURO